MDIYYNPDDLAKFSTISEGAPELRKKFSIDDFNLERLKNRRIITGAHCFACAAGAGSSRAGAII